MRVSVRECLYACMRARVCVCSEIVGQMDGGMGALDQPVCCKQQDYASAHYRCNVGSASIDNFNCGFKREFDEDFWRQQS